MSAITIRVPAQHIEAIRQSLAMRRGDVEQSGSSQELLVEIDRLIEQIGGSGASGPGELTGSRAVLWSAIYDAVCVEAERLAQDCNEYWTGAVDAVHTRDRITVLGDRFELLTSLGGPPRDDGSTSAA
jgi:hypothetical protein